jgi:hypothetical protein
MSTTPPCRHGRQVLVVDPLEGDRPAWVCEDCGCLMDTENPEREHPEQVR